MYQIFDELCTENNTTSYQVAKETGLSKALFYRWKSGKSTPKYSSLKKIADYFNVSVKYLMGEEEAEAIYDIGPEIEIIRLKVENNEYIIKYNGIELSKDDRKLVAAHLELIKEMLKRII